MFLIDVPPKPFSEKKKVFPGGAVSINSLSDSFGFGAVLEVMET